MSEQTEALLRDERDEARRQLADARTCLANAEACVTLAGRTSEGLRAALAKAEAERDSALASAAAMREAWLDLDAKLNNDPDHFPLEVGQAIRSALATDSGKALLVKHAQEIADLDEVVASRAQEINALEEENKTLLERLAKAERVAVEESDLRGKTEGDVCRLAALVRDYRDDHNDRTHEDCDGKDNGCYCTLCDRAVEEVGE